MKVHHSILEKLKKEEEDINIDPQIDEMRTKWAKRESDELKKLDKLLKKEKNDFEDVSQTGIKNLKAVYDRVSRTIKNARSLNETFYKVQTDSQNKHSEANEQRAITDKNLKLKSTLNTLCEEFLSKMFDQYYQHEIVLEDEQRIRNEMN